MARCTLVIALLALTSSLAAASDPGPLQDFCVGDNTSTVFVNGLVCKNPKTVVADDFFSTAFEKPGNTSNPLGCFVNLLDVNRFLGLNTLSIAMARLDFAPNGLNPPHNHPRSSEILTVIDGTLYAAFVTTDNKLFAKVLNKGDIFIFPQGLIHFQINPGHTNAVAIASFGSQNPGRTDIANAIFGSNPRIDVNVLAKAFQLDKKKVKELLAKSWASVS